MFKDTVNECGTYASWHPDNHHILVIAKERLPGLWMIDTDTWEFTPLAIPELGTIASGAVSPDGQTVIYSYSWGFPNPSEIWRFNAHGREVRHLFTSPMSPDYFVWSPDSRQILFFMNNLRVIDDQGNDLYSLDLGQPACTPRHYLPLMSPDGRYLAIQQDLSDEPYIHPWSKEAFAETSICLLDLASGETRSLIPGESQGIMHPAWSPDSSQIAFVSNRSGSSEIWAINVDGGNLRQVTLGGVEVRFPYWLRP
jgi:Tol biopolymer transport system component